MGTRLKDKVALVVGAGSSGPGWGNGKATAVTFAREGARVFCVDRNSPPPRRPWASSGARAARRWPSPPTPAIRPT